MHMLRNSLTAILMGMCLLVGGSLGYAQDATPSPLPTATPDAAAMMAQAAAMLEEARQLTEQATTQADIAVNLLGLFEAFSVVIAIVGAALGAFGFLRLISAQGELTKARKEIEAELVKMRGQFDVELETRRTQFDHVKSMVDGAVQQQEKQLTQATLATALLSFGERQYDAADYQGAVTTYRRALELDNHNPVIYYRLGYVLAQQGELELAEANLLTALRIEEAFPPALVTLGFVYRRQGEKLDGAERERLFNQGEQYMLRGLQLSPKLVDEDGESWWGSLGGLYRRRGMTEQAIYAYEQARLVTPQSSYPFGNLAALYGKAGNLDDMKRMYRRVEKLAWREVQAEVDNYWGYFDLLTAHLVNEHYDNAEQVLPTLLETVPLDAAYALDTLTETLERVASYLKGAPQEAQLNRFAEIIRAYKRAKEQNPALVPTDFLRSTH